MTNDDDSKFMAHHRRVRDAVETAALSVVLVLIVLGCLWTLHMLETAQ